MKSFAIGAIVIGGAALVGVALVGPSSATDSETVGTVTEVFAVEGMTCGGCEVAVRQAVGKLDGVESVKASHEEGRAEVTYDPEKVTTELIVEAIETLGYHAELQEQA